MRRLYILAFAFFVAAILMIYVKYSDEMSVKSTHNEWAEIINIEQQKRNLPKVGMKGTYSFYLVTVRLADGSTPTIRVTNISNIKEYECLPVSVSLFFSGDKMASVNNEEVLFPEIKKAPCDEST